MQKLSCQPPQNFWGEICAFFWGEKTRNISTCQLSQATFLCLILRGYTPESMVHFH